MNVVVLFVGIFEDKRISARALVKKRQEPGIKTQKADFSGMISDISPDECGRVPQNPPCGFFVSGVVGGACHLIVLVQTHIWDKK